MTQETGGSLKGHFIIAMPGLNDPNFVQTVACISEHSSAGAVGIVVNRVHPSLNAQMIFEELEIEHLPRTVEIPVHIGGPVHINEIFILHGPPGAWKGCLAVTESVFLSNTRDLLTAIAKGQGPRHFILALGCAGWGPGQLEFELRENTWLTGPLDERIMFEAPIEGRWDKAVRNLGIDPLLLSETSGHA